MIEQSADDPNQPRKFTGIWIKAEVWLNPSLLLVEKCLIAEIHSLSIAEKGCVASNKYFARLFNTTPATIAGYISNLRGKGYVKDLGFDGRKRKMFGYEIPQKELLDVLPKKVETRGRPPKPAKCSIKAGLNADLGGANSSIKAGLNADGAAYNNDSKGDNKVEKANTGATAPVPLAEAGEDKAGEADAVDSKASKVPVLAKEVIKSSEPSSPTKSADLFGEVVAAVRPSKVSDVPIPKVLDTPEFRDSWSRWLEDRKVRKKPVTVLAAEEQFKILAMFGVAKAIRSISNSIANGWQGLFDPDGNERNGKLVRARHGNSGEYEEHISIPVITEAQMDKDLAEARARRDANRLQSGGRL